METPRDQKAAALALRARVAKALDLSLSFAERGPRTMHARARLAAWLDDARAMPRGAVRSNLDWLETLIAKGDRRDV